MDRSKRTAPASGGVALYLASKRPLDRARERIGPRGSLSLAVLPFKARLRILNLKQRCETNLEGRHAGPPVKHRRRNNDPNRCRNDDGTQDDDDATARAATIGCQTAFL
jgi:hypothetical protein